MSPQPHRRIAVLAAVGVAALALPAAASAADYPPPSNPTGGQKKPKGPFHTLKVCKPKAKKARAATGRSRRPSTRPSRATRSGSPNGTYRESVRIFGAKKRYLKLIGNVGNPKKVVLDGKRLKGAASRTASSSTAPTR